MGFDISYHPIKEKEIQEWYFDVLNDNSKIDKLFNDFGIEEFYKNKYKETIFVGAKTKSTELFDKTHGYYIAVIQGFFRPYFYTRGSAFSFLLNESPTFKKYTKNWEQIITHQIDNPRENKITANYSSGVFIPSDQIEKLLNDYKSTENIKNDLDKFYSHKRINVFLKALEYCQENGMGLLEATEVVEPNPMELNKSISYSNLFNCDKDGVFLFEEAAMEQIREVETQNNLENGEITKNAEYLKTNVGEAEQKEKKGLWKKLFGK